MPALQGVALEGFGVSVDVGGLQIVHRVVEQHFPDEVLNAQIQPHASGDLAQVVTGPFPGC